MTIRVPFRDLRDGWVGQMVVVVVGDDHRVDDRDILDLTWGLSVALGT